MTQKDIEEAIEQLGPLIKQLEAKTPAAKACTHKWVYRNCAKCGMPLEDEELIYTLGQTIVDLRVFSQRLEGAEALILAIKMKKL